MASSSAVERSTAPSKVPNPDLPDELWLSEIAPYLQQPRRARWEPAHFGDIVSLASTCTKLHDILMPLIYSLGASDFDGDPHLIRAALRGCQTSFDRLLDAGAILRVKEEGLYELRYSIWESDLRSPLHAAAQGGQVEMMKHLLVLYGSHLPKVSHFRFRDNLKTPLDIASSMGHLEIVKLLKDIPFPNDTDTPQTQSPCGRRRDYLGNGIRCAARRGNLDIVKFLVEEGGNLHVAGKDENALELAVQYDHKDVVEYLFSIEAPRVDFNLLRLAFQRPGLDMVQTLLDNGVDIFAESTPEGKNAMYYTCSDPVKMRFLLERGLDPNHRDHWMRRTPLYHITRFSSEGPNKEECIRLLFEFGADPHLRTRDHERPLDYAMRSNELSLVKILLQYMSNAGELMDSRWVTDVNCNFNSYIPADLDDPEDRLRSASLREILSAVVEVERA